MLIFPCFILMIAGLGEYPTPGEEIMSGRTLMQLLRTGTCRHITSNDFRKEHADVAKFVPSHKKSPQPSRCCSWRSAVVACSPKQVLNALRGGSTFPEAGISPFANWQSVSQEYKTKYILVHSNTGPTGVWLHACILYVYEQDYMHVCMHIDTYVCMYAKVPRVCTHIIQSIYLSIHLLVNE
jgi:hypothetical protein